MRFAISWFLLLLLPATAVAQSPNPARTRSTLTALYRKALDAVVRRDTVTLSGIYPPQYHFTLSAGDSIIDLSRAERLESIAASRDSIRTLNLESCQIELFGTFAIAGCWIRQQGVATLAGDWTGIYNTVVFKQDSKRRWWIVRNHSSVNRVQRR